MENELFPVVNFQLDQSGSQPSYIPHPLILNTFYFFSYLENEAKYIKLKGLVNMLFL